MVQALWAAAKQAAADVVGGLQAAGARLDEEGGLSCSYLQGVLTSTLEGGLLVWYEQDLLRPQAAAVFRPEGSGVELLAACAAPGKGLMRSLLVAVEDSLRH